MDGNPRTSHVAPGPSSSFGSCRTICVDMTRSLGKLSASPFISRSCRGIFAFDSEPSLAAFRFRLLPILRHIQLFVRFDLRRVQLRVEHPFAVEPTDCQGKNNRAEFNIGILG